MNFTRQFLSLIAAWACLFLSANAQTTQPPSLANVAIPPAPDAAALGRYAEIPVSLYTGIPQVSIPVWQLQGRDLSMPVSLSYHASGLRVDDIASRVGLGWSLSAGGAITRTVNGLPDETPQGWLNVAAQLPLPAQSGAHSSAAYIAQQKLVLMDIARGRMDGQPDQFFVNMPGYSGKIIFDRNGDPQSIPYQKLKIETDWANRTWTITTTDGITYRFGGAATERTVTASDCGQSQSNGFISTWYLTEITSPNGDRITLDYQSGGLISYPLPLSETAYLGTSGNAACATKATDRCGGQYFTGIVRIEKISSARGLVTFEYDSQPRLDVPGDRRLASVTVRDKANNPVRTFALSHSYFSGRLMLDAVIETGANNTQSAPTTISYYKDKALPPRGSFNQDHWGFANGASNTTLLPKTELPDCRVLGSANRRPDFFYSRAGSIQKITYPAGGSSSFEYEAHRFDPGPAGMEATAQTLTAKAFCAGGPCGSPSCTGCQPTEIKTFTLDSKQCVEFDLLLDNPQRPQGICDGEIRLRKVNGPVLQIWNCSAQSATQNYVLDLFAGDYQIETRAYLPDDFARATVNFTKSIPNREQLAGGIRIRRITDHDNIDPANDIVREFSYESSPGVSSGALVKVPSYLFDYTEERAANSSGSNTFFNCLFKAASGSSIVPLGSTQGGHVGYGQVTTHYGAGGSNGTMTSYFVNPRSVPDGLFEYPYGPVTSNDHRRGLLLRSITRDNQGKTISETLNEYEDGTTSAIQNSIAGLSVAFWRRSTMFPNDPIANPMMVRKYFHHSQWGYLKKTTDRTFDENGTDYQQITTEFEYNNPAHTQLTTTKTTDSHGRELITTTRYPADFSTGTGDPYANAITKLKTDKFMHAVPIEQVTAQKKPNQPTQVIAANLTLYKEFYPGKFFPEQLFLLETDQPISNFQFASINGTFSKDSRYRSREVAEKYDPYGHLIQVLQKDGIRASYRWGYDRTLPIAQMLNATSAHTLDPLDAECAYAGFESGEETNGNPNEDFWQFNSQNSHSSDAHTGANSRRIRPGGNRRGPERELRPLDQTATYVFSAWVKTPSNYAGGKLTLHSKKDNNANGVFPPSQLYNSQTTVNIPATSNQWQYIEAKLDLGKIRTNANVPLFQQLRLRATIENNDNSNALKIDDLRIQPEGARMTTFTFDPLTGRTSTSDVNDIATYYEYDGLGRLALTRDQDRKILSRHQYQFSAQSQLAANRIITDLLQVPRTNPNVINTLPIGQKQTTFQYTDGFGREIEKLNVGVTPNKGDLVTFTDYDEFGRQPKAFLPYEKPANGGGFIANPLPEQLLFYRTAPRVADSDFPFAESVFDGSPLNRVTQQGAPGAAWQIGGGHTTDTRYITNTVTQPVRKWEITYNNCISTSYFPKNELTGTHISDPDEGEVYQFKDKLDRLIYQKVKRIDGNVKQGGLVVNWQETYFVYDDFGNLVYVIPPKAMDLMRSSASYDVNALQEDLVFRNKYDHRQRRIERKIPGKDFEEFVYDNLDRQILSRDGNLRANNQWKFTKYDRLGRVIMTGIFDNNTFNTRQSMQTLVDNVLGNQVYQNHEKRTSQNFSSQQGYTQQAFPNPGASSGVFRTLSVHYFDDYDFDQDGQPDANWTPDPDGEYASTQFGRTRDLVTGLSTKVLNRQSLSAPVSATTTTSFYDKYGRTTHTKTQNHLGDTDLSFSEFDFAGKLEKSKTIHRSGTNNQIKIRNRYAYDHAARIKKVWQQNNNDPEILLAKSEYNALGELVEKNVHKVPGQRFLQSVDYRYHIRGWMKSINDCELRNDFAQGQRLWYVDEVTTTVRKTEDQYGREQLSLEVDIRKCDQPGPNIPNTKIVTESKTIPLTIDSNSTAWAQLFSIENTPLTVSHPFTLLDSAGIDSAEARTAGQLAAQLNSLAVTDPAAKQPTLTGTCGFVLEQKQIDFNNDDNNDLFGMEFSYEEGMLPLQGDPTHTGNMSGLCWKSRSDMTKRGYGFRYDTPGRLKSAHYAAMADGGKKWDIEIGHYDVPDIEYDANGNILQLSRHGWRSNATFGLIDDLRYRYSGNRLQAVTEQAPQSGPHDFRDNGATTLQDYLYDDNGNLIADANKAMTVVYNHLDLPETVDFGGGNRVEFLYDAVGTKLAQLVVNAASNSLRKDYVGGFVYAGGALEFFATEGGRCVPDSGGRDYRHELHYTDHLGSLRLAYSDFDRNGKVDVSEIVQENHYYPFGMTFRGLGTVQQGPEHKFQYNGKEMSDAHGLYWTDYGARFYDGQLGRWHAVDPLAEEFLPLSPYNYAFNNPVLFIDPDGASPLSVFAKKAAKLGLKKAAKEMVGNHIKKKLASYMSKGWAKKLSSDAMDAIDKVTEQAWWEYGVEAIPLIGDIYGGVNFAKQIKKVWKVAEKFENIATVTAKVAKKGWQKINIDLSNVTGAARDKLEFFHRKLNNIGGDHLKEDDLAGAVRDMYGEPVVFKGHAYDHLGEVGNSLRDMDKRLVELKNGIMNGEFEGEALKVATSLYVRANNQRKQIQGVGRSAMAAYKEYRR